MPGEDITGQRFGRLVALNYVRTKEYVYEKYVVRQYFWRFKCDCGNEKITSVNEVKRGHTKSCGCLFKETKSNLRHGMRWTHIYYIWQQIKQRCNNPKKQFYYAYGARGISVCKEWMESFENFYDYVSKLPHYGEEGYSLDRIDNDGNYEPGNVRWATAIQQSNNLRKNVHFLVDGVSYTPREYADKHGLSYSYAYWKFVRQPKERKERADGTKSHTKHHAGTGDV